MEMEDIWMRLKAARKNAGYKSARAFASQHNLPYITYSQHESGSRRINPDTILKYASILKVSPAWLFVGEESDCYLDDSDSLEKNNAGLGKNKIAKIDNCERHERIDVSFLGDIFEEINAVLTQENIKMRDKDKVVLSMELYYILTNNPQNLREKNHNLIEIIKIIKKINSKIAA